MNDAPNPGTPPSLERRRLFRRAAAAGFGVLAAGAAQARKSASGDLSDELPEGELEYLLAASSCVLTPMQTPGPFYVNGAMVRTDITEGTQGVPLSLIFRVVSASNCNPIPNAMVDVWHNDPAGAYSGFASQGTAGQTQLRGIQFTDLSGEARFETIYPGWYPGRTPHLHVKVRPQPNQELTTQVYFPDAAHAAIFKLPPYDQKGPTPITNLTDGFYVQQNQMRIARKPALGLAVVAGITLVVA